MPLKGEAKRKYQREFIAARRADWIASKGGKCAQCGSMEQLEVDHVDPSTKLVSPTFVWSRNQAFRDAELAKCQVLCHDCHLAKTFADTKRGHGTRYRYRVLRCRCDACRAKNAEEVRGRRARSASK